MKLLWRIWYRGYRMTSSVRHWSARRFTHAGLMVCAALIISAILAPDTENNTAYQAFAFLLTSLLLAVAVADFFYWPFLAPGFFSPFATPRFNLTFLGRVQNTTPKK